MKGPGLLFAALERASLSDEPDLAVSMLPLLSHLGPDAKGLAELFEAAPTEAEGFRRLAMALDGAGRAGMGWHAIRVAMALEPENEAHKRCAVLVSMSLGRTPEAEVWIAEIGDDQLAAYYDARFPALGMWVPSIGGIGSARVQRSLGQVRRQLSVYATRLAYWRSEHIAAGAAPHLPWMLPELKGLLPGGLIPLTDEEMPTPCSTSITRQELVVSDWAALCVMAWLSGLDSLTLPSSLQPRIKIGPSVAWAQYKLWRARDQAINGGAIAKAQATRETKYRGRKMSALAAPVAHAAAHEAAEVQAAVLWLTDRTVVSPFGPGLRES